jgi:hypothetical protein
MRLEIPAVQEQLKKLSLQTIARIDPGLALHSGLTPDELDIMINCDIKFRLGQAESGDDEQEAFNG